MKKLLSLLSVIALISSFETKSCPTCQGRIEKESPPFFTDDFYAHEESMDYIYQELLQKQAEEQDTEGRV